MDEAKERNKAHESLYRGTSSEKLAGVAPYIFQFRHPTPFSEWYFRNGWGRSWGILLKSSSPMAELHKHFRKFLMVRTEPGKQLYFRFYDPRVLRIFLPTCDAAQIRELFGPIDYFLIEDEDPAFAFRCWQENGVLKMLRLKVDIALPAGNAGNPAAPDPAGTERSSGISSAVDAPKKPEGSQPGPESPAPPKPKTRWNMFD